MLSKPSRFRNLKVPTSGFNSFDTFFNNNRYLPFLSFGIGLDLFC